MKIDFMNIPVDALTMDQTINLVDDAICEGRNIHHVVINAGKVVLMQTDQQLYQSVVSCDIINADGQSIVWAARLLGAKLPERVAGADLMPNLVKLSHEKGYKCFFFGAKEEVVKKVVDIYTKEYGPEIIAGYRNGYYSPSEEAQIAQQIADSGANMLFVAVPSPKKENFLYNHKDVLHKVNFTMGVGGTFDVITGVTKRAPVWMQHAGMEWFYRFIQEPRRMWKRYLVGNAKFVWLVLSHRMRRSI
ncbi:MAG: WecB/TagA/CpsF family glycosyltransferase [Saprospiraceae bacterium]|nr:WecB/TagA/CpsF family glycosyltransferase [Lewinella sp.]